MLKVEQVQSDLNFEPSYMPHYWNNIAARRCEAVTFHQGLPRCPNGYHRSPSASCEPVNVNGNSEGNNNILPNNGNGNGIIAENPSSNNSTISRIGQCDQTLWNHVYNPARRCVGTINDFKVGH